MKAKPIYFYLFISNNLEILACLEIMEGWELFRSERHKLEGGIIETEGFETHGEGLSGVIQEQLNNVKRASKTPIFQEAKALGQAVNKEKSEVLSRIAQIVKKVNNMHLDDGNICELSGKIARNIIHRCVFPK